MGPCIGDNQGFPIFWAIKQTPLKQYLYVAALLLTMVRVHGQPSATDKYTDSLEQRIRMTTADTGKANGYFLLSDYWADRDTGKALSYLRRYFQLGIRDDYTNGVAHFYLGGVYFDADLVRSQQEYLVADSLLSPFTTSSAYLYRSRAWHNYGALEERKDNNRGFVDIQLNKVIPLAMMAGDSIRVGINYNDVGEVFMNFEEYDKARGYYAHALRLLRAPGTNREMLAECYISAAKNEILDNKAAGAGPWLDTARQVLAQRPASTYLPYWYWVEGMRLNGVGQLQAALDTLQRGLALADSLGRRYDVTSILFEEYYVYRKLKQYPRARAIMQKVYDQNLLMPLANNRRRILFELAQTESDLGHPDAAYRWLFAYTKLADSMNAAKTTEEIAALEARYRSAEKEKEILELHNRSKVQRILFIGGLLLSVGLLLFFANRSRQRRRQNEQQLRSLQQQQKIEVTSALLRGEERERQRLARDLHDGLGGMLAGVKIRLSEMAFHTQPENPELQKVIRQLDHSVRELRHIAHNLMPESLTRSGLETALSDLCESAATDSTKVIFQLMNISPAMDGQTQLILYRIVQELLANVLKHARASEVFVQCSQSEDIFYIAVEDDGAGFDPDAADAQKGIGLANIRNRVSFLQGKMDIESAPGKGTIVNIEIHVA